jgi:hypothetical protein
LIVTALLVLSMVKILIAFLVKERRRKICSNTLKKDRHIRNLIKSGINSFLCVWRTHIEVFIVYWNQQQQKKVFFWIIFYTFIFCVYSGFYIKKKWINFFLILFRLRNRLETRYKSRSQKIQIFFLKFNIFCMFWIVLMCWCEK